MMKLRRDTKTPEAIAAIRATQTAVEAAATAVIAYLKAETHPIAEQAHHIIDTILTEHGCESPEGHIVAGGTASAEPHEKGSGVLRPHEPIVIDIYPRSKESRYYADMTRTVCMETPPVELQKMYDTVLAAQERAIAMIKPGIKCNELQMAVIEHFADAGYKTYGSGREFRYAEGYVHSLGHGVGKAIHEAPSLSLDSQATLAAGDVITIEPGLYYKHIGGVRLEDLLVVTETGVENLTTFPKALMLSS